MANYYQVDYPWTGSLTDGDYVIFSSGGVASKCKISAGAHAYIGPKGAASETSVFSGGYMEFQSGSLPSDKNTVLSGGVLSLGLGTEAGNITAENGAILQVTMGGIWFVKRPTDYVITSNGTAIKKTGTSSSTSNGIVYAGYTGWDMKTSGCMLNIVDYASAAFVKVSSGCSLGVGGGQGYGAGAAGQIDVYNGGSAILEKANYVGLATVHSGGTMTLGAYSENTTVMENGGYLYIPDESILLPDLYPDYDLNVKIKPNTFKDLVLSGAYRGATAHSGTVASHTTLKDSASLGVFNGGSAVNTVLSGGWLVVESGGVASGVTIEGTKGLINVSGGGKLTGKLKFGNGTVFVESGGIIDFDISALKGNTDALLTNYNQIVLDTGELHNTITVSGEAQAKGAYALATKAYSLSLDSESRSEQEKIFAICDTAGAKLGAVKIGTKALVGDQTYALNLSGSGDLSLTVAAYVEGDEIWTESGNDADDHWNDYMFYPRSKELHENVKKFKKAQLPSDKTILLDKLLSRTVNKVTYKNYVGEDDGVDFAKISLATAAKLSFTVDSTQSVKFTVWELVPGRNDTYTLKSLETVSTKKASKKATEYTGTSDPVLLYPGEYYVSVSASTKKGFQAYYNVSVDKENSTFYTQGDNSDDWDDREENGADGKVDRSLGQLKTGKINNLTDLYSDWVGFGDTVDFKRLRLQATEKLFLFVEATEAVVFSVYTLNDDNSLKKVVSTKLTKNKRAQNEYYALTEALLGAGDCYFSVELANPKKGGDANYTVAVAGYSYTKADRTDDSFDTAKDIGTMSGDAARTHNEALYSNWVGWEDESDCMKFTLASAARLRFFVASDEGTLFSLCDGDSQKAILKANVKKSKYAIDGCEATTKEVMLEAGDYYFRMQSTNAKKYGYSDYKIELYGGVFFSDGDGRTNDTLLNSERKLDAGAKAFQSTPIAGNKEILVDKNGTVSQKIDNVTYKNFVGFGDEKDYAKIVLSHNGKLSFSVTATDVGKFTLYKLVPGRNDTFSAKSLLSGKLSKGRKDTVFSFSNAKGIQLLAGEVYYVCVESTNAKKSEYGTYYNVSVEYESMDQVREGKLASALEMPEVSSAAPDILAADGAGDVSPLSECLMPASAFADASVVGASVPLDISPDGQPFWQNIAGLA